MSTALDEDLVILENLDFKLTCTMNDQCDIEPTWQFIHAKCCGFIDFACDKHKAEADAWLEHVKSRSLRCRVCGANRLDATDFKWETL